MRVCLFMMNKQINRPVRDAAKDSHGIGFSMRVKPSPPLTKDRLNKELYHAKGLTRVSVREVSMVRMPDRAPPMEKNRVK